MSAVIVSAYLIGALLGIAPTRVDGLARIWPRLVRAQLLAATVALSIVAVWRLQGLESSSGRC